MPTRSTPGRSRTLGVSSWSGTATKPSRRPLVIASRWPRPTVRCRVRAPCGACTMRRCLPGRPSTSPAHAGQSWTSSWISGSGPPHSASGTVSPWMTPHTPPPMSAKAGARVPRPHRRRDRYIPVQHGLQSPGRAWHQPAGPCHCRRLARRRGTPAVRKGSRCAITGRGGRRRHAA